MTREQQLLENLHRVRTEIAELCAKYDRDGSDVTLVGVTKTWPSSDARILIEAGLADIGENKEQEATRKRDELKDLDFTLHFLGGIQSNKIAKIARCADVVHSLDRQDHAVKLGAAATAIGRNITALVQVDFAEGEVEGRSGVAPSEVLAMAAAIHEIAGLTLGGVMTVAPLDVEPRGIFDHLHQLALEVQTEFPHATIISAGMSADLEAAIAAGATHVRIGSALLGNRTYVQ